MTFQKQEQSEYRLLTLSAAAFIIISDYCCIPKEKNLYLILS